HSQIRGDAGTARRGSFGTACARRRRRHSPTRRRSRGAGAPLPLSGFVPMTTRICPPRRREDKRGYSLQIEHPQTGATTFESHPSLAAVVASAAERIQEGYSIGIWSAASREQRPRGPIAANDDVWLDTLSEPLA